MLDTLHAARIEIVSPTFMNTRALSTDEAVIPTRRSAGPVSEPGSAESIAFDKADDAASIEETEGRDRGTDGAD